MKRHFTLLVATLFVVIRIEAVPASPEPFNVIQPNGDTLTLHMVGDEYYHWAETNDNRMVILSKEGYYEYATILDGDIVASGIRAHNELYNSQLKTSITIANKESLMEVMMQKRETIITRMDSLAKIEEALETLDSTTPARATSTSSLTEGNQKVLCILIGFPDQPFTKSKNDFFNMWNQPNYNEEGSFGSVRDFYVENSYGHMNVTATVVGPYTAKHNSSYYATGADISSSNVRDLVKEALTAAKNDIKFKDFDTNGDKYVDAVHIVFARYAYDADTTYGLIWSHHWSLSNSVYQGLYKAKQYFITSELAGGSGHKIAPIGTVCHEYGHQLGAPDYYSNIGYTGTGAWDVMGNGSWNGQTGNRGRCPAHHNPYTKAYIFNWLTPAIISSSTANVTYTLTPSHNTTSIYRINTSTNNEFFLLEYKKNEINTFNYWVPAPGGLLIYHIHNDIANAIANQNVNNSHPQKCYIVCANATSNPTSVISSYGTTGISCAYPYAGKIFFTSNSIPSATSWAGNATGLNLCFIQRADGNIKFVINPQINGEATLSTQSTYSIRNIPPGAKIKWTYTFKPLNGPASGQSSILQPIIFINGDSTASVVLQRGKYPVMPGIPDTIPTTPWDSIPAILKSTSTNAISYKYYTGTVTLKATITSGGYSYVITKTITLTSSTNTLSNEKRNDTTDTIGTQNENPITVLDSSSRTYTLSHENPMLSSTCIVHINKFSDLSREYVPYNGTYTLEIWSNRLGLIERISNNNADLYLNCEKFHSGVYQIILIVDGNIVAQSKMLIL